jgi:branched-chain amino acid transport system permease protein
LPAASRSGARAIVLLGVGAAAALSYPWLAPNSYMRYAGVLTVMYALLATSWNLVGGFTGYVSLGHAAFFGVGAYGTGLAVTDLDLPHVAALGLAAVGTMVFAAVVGLAAVRVRGASFVIVSVALVAMMSLIAQEARWLTGGSSGLRVPPLSEELDRTANHVLFFYLFAAVLVLALVTWWFVDRSRFGAGLKAIRDDEDKAESLGVPTTAYKVAVLTLSAGFTGLAGGLYGIWFGNLDPIFVFSVVLGVNMVLMALLGGVRHLFGPLLGALIVAPSGEYFLTQHGESELHKLLSGALLVVVVLFLPDGVIPSIRGLLSRFGPTAASIREQTEAELHGGGRGPGPEQDREEVPV